MLKERDFQNQVIELARLKGWLVAHFRPGMMRSGNWVTPVQADGAGFPDLVMVHPEAGRVVFAEIKSSAGRLTRAQKRWLAALEMTPAEVYCWRPQDWDNIVAILA